MAMMSKREREMLLDQLRGGQPQIGGAATPLAATQATPAAQPLGTLTGKNLAQINTLRRKPTSAMDAISASSSPTMFTALAKAGLAGFAGSKGRKERGKEADVLQKALQKIADEEAAQKSRTTKMENERLDISREKADRENEVHLERDITNDMKMFEAINPGLQRGTKEYGEALGQYQKNQETNYGTRGSTGGSGGSTSAIIQRHDRWKEINPNATPKQVRDAYDRILSSYRTTTIAGVERMLTEPTDPLSGETIEETQSEELTFAAKEQRAKQAGKNTADMSLEMGNEIQSVSAQIEQFQRYVEDGDFDDSVGWFDGWIGQMSQNFGFDEGLLGRQVEMFADGITLQQSKFFKGNLNQKEIDILENSKPKREDDEKTWKKWFADYKRAYDTAMRNYAIQPNRYLEQNLPNAGGRQNETAEGGLESMSLEELYRQAGERD